MKAGSRLVLAIFLTVVTTLGAAQAVRAGTPRTDGFGSLCGAMDSTHPARVKHVMFILLENRSYRAVVGSGAAPYLNNKLIPGCGLATNYHSYSHPSAPNYLALTSGTAHGKAAKKDCMPSACPQPQNSIFGQLGRAGRTWREYAEAMQGHCRATNDNDKTYKNANGTTGEMYYVRHAPPPYYTSAPVPGECSRWDVPLGTSASGKLLTALSPRQDGLPAFSFVTPGGCDDMHDCGTTAGDDWLRKWIPLIQRSAAYQSGQLVVFITWDEGEGPDKANGETCWDAKHANSSAFPSCHVATIVMSPHTTPGRKSSAYFNHLSLLGTAEHLLGLPRLPAAQRYTGLESAFGL